MHILDIIHLIYYLCGVYVLKVNKWRSDVKQNLGFPTRYARKNPHLGQWVRYSWISGLG